MSHRPLGLDLYRPEPADNPTRPAAVALGRRLFHEPLLSRDGSITCANCHRPAQAFTDGRARSIGVFGRRGTRSVPTLINRAWGESFFWDGRIDTLEEQVLRPIEARVEMDLPIEEAVARLGRDDGYREAFVATFGRDANRDDLARALAAYVRTIQAGSSPFDRYFWGDRKALPAEARAGLALFRGRANCTACHAGAILTDEAFHNTGVAWRPTSATSNTEPLDQPRDVGRFGVTGEPADLGAFKTPTLREVAHTAPYMHDGSFATLEDVVDFYDGGGQANPHLDPEIRPLGLTAEEKKSLVALLRSLTGTVSDAR